MASLPLSWAALGAPGRVRHSSLARCLPLWAHLAVTLPLHQPRSSPGMREPCLGFGRRWQQGDTTSEGYFFQGSPAVLWAGSLRAADFQHLLVEIARVLVIRTLKPDRLRHRQSYFCANPICLLLSCAPASARAADCGCTNATENWAGVCGQQRL